MSPRAASLGVVFEDIPIVCEDVPAVCEEVPVSDICSIGSVLLLVDGISAVLLVDGEHFGSFCVFTFDSGGFLLLGFLVFLFICSTPWSCSY